MHRHEGCPAVPSAVKYWKDAHRRYCGIVRQGSFGTERRKACEAVRQRPCEAVR